VKGDRAANFAMQNSDLIISIGSSLHVSVTGYDYDLFAREAKKIVVDIDETSHKKKTISIDLFVKADAKIFLNQLIDTFGEEIHPPSANEWLDQCIVWKNKYKVCLPEYAEMKGAISMYSLVEQLSLQAKEGDVFVADAGSAFYVVSQAVRLLHPNQRYIPSGAMATMGYSLPAAIGVSVALGKKRVLAITGDGSLQQNIQELQTVIEYGLPIKLFVFNNDGYLSIRASQVNYFKNRFIGESNVSGVSFPDTLKIAEAYGIKAIRVNELSQLDEVIKDVLEYDGPIICDVITPREQKVIPTTSSRLNPDGTMTSRPLEDMAPFLDRDEYRSNLYIKEV
jgi:acetolactate synthase I/II/III large subunit